jgi:hypothetical protein
LAEGRDSSLSIQRRTILAIEGESIPMPSDLASTTKALKTILDLVSVPKAQRRAQWEGQFLRSRNRLNAALASLHETISQEAGIPLIPELDEPPEPDAGLATLRVQIGLDLLNSEGWTDATNAVMGALEAVMHSEHRTFEVVSLQVEDDA